MFARLLLTGLVLISTDAVAQSAHEQVPPTTSSPPKRTEILEYWGRSTVSLGQLVYDGNLNRYNTLGSAIIITINKDKSCILTAKHLLQKPSKGYLPGVIQVRPPMISLSQSVDYGVEVKLIVSGKNTWRSLPDGSDLAVVPIPDISSNPFLRGISPNYFGSDEDVFQGAPIVALGYPTSSGEYTLQWPIARAGIIAWVDPADRFGNPFLVDANFFNGNSGGPVIRVRNMDRFGNFSLGGGLSLIGIVSRDSQENAPVTFGEQPTRGIENSVGPPGAAGAQVLHIGGLGLIEPISKAKFLIDQYCGKPADAIDNPSLEGKPNPPAQEKLP